MQARGPCPLFLSPQCALLSPRRNSSCCGDGLTEDGTVAPKSVFPNRCVANKGSSEEETPRSNCQERQAARSRRTRRRSSERVARGEACPPRLPLFLIRDLKKLDNLTRNQTELPHLSVACRGIDPGDLHQRGKGCCCQRRPGAERR